MLVGRWPWRTGAPHDTGRRQVASQQCQEEAPASWDPAFRQREAHSVLRPPGGASGARQFDAGFPIHLAHGVLNPS